jgi:hypothetical protein
VDQHLPQVISGFSPRGDAETCRYIEVDAGFGSIHSAIASRKSSARSRAFSTAQSGNQDSEFLATDAAKISIAAC